MQRGAQLIAGAAGTCQAGGRPPRRRRRRMGLLRRYGVVAVAVGMVVTACGDQPAAGSGVAPTSTVERPLITAAPVGFSAADLAFASNMIAQHQQTLSLSVRVPGRSLDPTIIDLARNVDTRLRGDLSILKALRLQWTGGDDETTAAQPEGTASSATLDAAESARLDSLSGAEFDSLWVQLMIESCEGTQRLAGAEVAGGQNPDAVAVATQIVSATRATVGELKAVTPG